MEKGFIAISAVLVILAVILAIVTTVSLLSIGEGQASLALFKGEDALTFVEGCTEDALLKSLNSSSYNGGNITRPEGTCTVSISKAGNTWALTVSTTNTSYVRTITVSINRTGYGLTLNSWSET